MDSLFSCTLLGKSWLVWPYFALWLCFKTDTLWKNSQSVKYFQFIQKQANWNVFLNRYYFSYRWQLLDIVQKFVKMKIHFVYQVSFVLYWKEKTFVIPPLWKNCAVMASSIKNQAWFSLCVTRLIIGGTSQSYDMFRDRLRLWKGDCLERSSYSRMSTNHSW